MSAAVITGTGLITAAGLGHEPLLQALAAGTTFVDWNAGQAVPSSRVSEALFTWPDLPIWQTVREYSAFATKLSVTAAMQALARAAASTIDSKRAASLVVTLDDWSEQAKFDAALSRVDSFNAEARALFENLDDQFLLRSFRWAIGASASGLSAFTGPSLNVDAPNYGGLSALSQARDLIESGDVDAVLIVGIASALRSDMVSVLAHSARAHAETRFALGQGAAALLLESEAVACERGQRALAKVTAFSSYVGENVAATAHRVAQELGAKPEECLCTWTSGIDESRVGARDEHVRRTDHALGCLLQADSLVHACLAAELLATTPGKVRILSGERFWGTGAAGAVLESVGGSAA